MTRRADGGVAPCPGEALADVAAHVRALGRLLQDEDATKSQAVMRAMMRMDKIDIAGLERAYAHA